MVWVCFVWVCWSFCCNLLWLILVLGFLVVEVLLWYSFPGFVVVGPVSGCLFCDLGVSCWFVF